MQGGRAGLSHAKLSEIESRDEPRSPMKKHTHTHTHMQRQRVAGSSSSPLLSVSFGSHTRRSGCGVCGGEREEGGREWGAVEREKEIWRMLGLNYSLTWSWFLGRYSCVLAKHY